MREPHTEARPRISRLEDRDKGERRAIRHPPSDVRVHVRSWIGGKGARLLKQTLVHEASCTPLLTLASRSAHVKPPPPPGRDGGGCVGCARRNWVRQTRGRPSQAEARESSRRFRLEAVPWKPPRSPSPLLQSVDDPSLSPPIAWATASPVRVFHVDHPAVQFGGKARDRERFGTEARGTSRDMDNVQMIGTKITAIKEYLYNFARTHSPTRLMSSENTYALSREHCNLKYSDILPNNVEGFPATREFLMKVVDILLDFVKSTNDRNAKILDFHHPSEMMRLLDLEIPDSGLTLQQLLIDCSTTLKYQVKTGHPRFFNQLSCGLDLVSMAGEWLTATANTNMFTYEIAPVFILMEHVVLQKMRELIGWNGGDSILAPGGSISNLYAFLAARHKMFPTYKERGLSAVGGQLVMFTSDQCHYSVKSCASVCGLGTDNCVMVPSDERGRMIPSRLEELIMERKAKGHIPFFVNATAGTTVIGAFDPIPEIADICQRHKLWLHIDAAWGGGLLLSRKYRHPRLTGIERADSVTWNPHKLMGALLQCSTIHFKEDGLLISCNQMSAEYLFMTDKLYDVKYDTGDKVIQCGRHNDIFKLWLQWRAKGTEGFEKHMDRLMELTEHMVRRIKQMPDKYYLILEPEMVNVCFWYLPTRVRNMPHGPERIKIIADICPILKARMMQAGTLMVGYQPDDRRPNFFRNIISSAAVTESDVDFLLAEMDRLGHDL